MSTTLQKQLGVKRAAKKRTQDDGEHFLRELADYAWQRCAEKNVGWARGSEFGFHKTALASVFDDKERVDKRRIKKGSSAGETWVGEVLRKVAKERGITVGDQPVGIKTVLEQLGRPVCKTQPHRESFQNYIDDGASFDFVLYQDGRPFLAVEVDGAYHRFPYEEGKGKEEQYRKFRRRWCQDRLKDALVREVIGGQVFQGNQKHCTAEWREKADERETDQWAQPTGDFALLRLPDDGTTYLETDALRGAAPKALADQVFTLEDLMERYRPAQALSLSATLSAWSEKEREALRARLDGKGSLTSKVQARLKALGLLKKTKDGWCPTRKGKDAGIQEGVGEDFRYPLYSPAARERLKRLLLEGESPKDHRL